MIAQARNRGVWRMHSQQLAFSLGQVRFQHGQPRVKSFHFDFSGFHDQLLVGVPPNESFLVFNISLHSGDFSVEVGFDVGHGTPSAPDLKNSDRHTELTGLTRAPEEP